MNKTIQNLVVIAIIVIASSSNLFAITKVAARFNVMEFTVGSAHPIGSYDRIGIGVQGFLFEDQFGQLYKINANDLYENSTSFGINYGRLINDNILFNVGISYTNILHFENFEQLVGNYIYTYYYPKIYKLRMYNVDFNWNYYFMSPVKQTFAPFAGVGLQAGLLSVSVADFASESNFVLGLGFNFGADLNVWKSSDKMAQLNVSSVNTYQIYASDSRPKYMTIGLGLKYYFRP